MRDSNYVKRLYQGLAAEQLVASQFSELGYECLKPAVDLGVDFVVRPLAYEYYMKYCMPPGTTLHVQVKSRRVEWPIAKGSRGEPEYILDFGLKECEIKMLENAGNGYVVFVCYLPKHPLTPVSQHFSFWLATTDVRRLLTHQAHNLNSEESYEWNLKVVYQGWPELNVDSLVSTLFQDGEINHAGVARLKKALPLSIALHQSACCRVLIESARVDYSSRPAREELQERFFHFSCLSQSEAQSN